MEIAHTLTIKKRKLDDFEVDLDESFCCHSGKEAITRHPIEHYRSIERANLGYPIILSKEHGNWMVATESEKHISAVMRRYTQQSVRQQTRSIAVIDHPKDQCATES